MRNLSGTAIRRRDVIKDRRREKLVITRASHELDTVSSLYPSTDELVYTF